MKCLYVFVTLLLSLLFPAAVKAQANMAELHATTHRIKMETMFEWSACSATAIAPHALLTASHCEEAADTVAVDGKEVPVIFVARDGNDHSILLLDGIEFKHVAKVENVIPQQGDTIFYWGNPNGYHDIFRRGYYAGTIDGLPWADGQKHKAMMLSVNEGEGDSGAGVFNEQGKLFTVMSFNRSDITVSKQFAGALPLEFTADQLKLAKEF